MAKLAKSYVAHIPMPKKTSQANKKNKCKMSSVSYTHLTLPTKA